jgi:hypothetical protein
LLPGYPYRLFFWHFATDYQPLGDVLQSGLIVEQAVVLKDKSRLTADIQNVLLAGVLEGRLNLTDAYLPRIRTL